MPETHGMASFQQMAEANSANDFTALDYIYYAKHQNPISRDLIKAILSVLSPALEQIDGRALIPSVGAVERYKKYREKGQSPPQAQWWANLTLLTDLFGEADESTVKILSSALALCWNEVLSRHTWASGQEARVVEDEVEGEIFVTVQEASFQHRE